MMLDLFAKKKELRFIAESNIASFILFLFRHEKYLNLLTYARNAKKAAMLVNNKFKINAPREELIAEGKYIKEKWDFFNAAQYLIKCNSKTIVAILNEWSKIPAISFKPLVMITIWLTAPPFKDDESQKKVVEVADLLAWSNKDLLKNILENGSHTVSIALLSRMNAFPVDFLLKEFNFDLLFFLLLNLKKNSPEKFNQRYCKLPPKFAAKFNAKMLEMHKLFLYQQASSFLDRWMRTPVNPPPKCEPNPPPSDPKSQEKQQGNDDSPSENNGALPNN